MTLRNTVALALVVLVACVALDEPEPGTGSPPPAETAAPAPPSPSPAAAARSCGPPPSCAQRPRLAGVFDVERVPEASGLAASRRNPGLSYVVDDEPGTAAVGVLGPDAALLGTLRVTGMEARNAEGLAVGPCGPGDPATCVYVGDIGDNRRRRERVEVHRFVEPDLSEGLGEGVVGADAIALRYPDGPADAEALLVDGEGVPLLVTKARYDEETGETGPTRVYRAPGYADGTLEPLGEVALPEPQLALAASVVGNVVTGGDSVPGRVLLRTYDAVLSYDAPTPDAPVGSFPSWPVTEVPSALQRQSEAVALHADGCGYSTVAEGSGELWSVSCAD
jgi:hypothetical protein